MGWGNFMRAPLSWWDGPVDAWSHFTPRMGGGPWEPMPDVRATGAYRRWPLRFRDADGVQELWKRLYEFAGEGGRVTARPSGGTPATTVSSLLGQPERALTGGVRFEAERAPEPSDEVGVRGRALSVSVDLLSEPEDVRAWEGFRPAFVVIRSFTPAQPGPDDYYTAEALRDLLEEHCSRMTLWQRRRAVPVLTKRTEAEVRAGARKLRLGVLGGIGTAVLGIASSVLGPVLARWLGVG
ncbi:hypothetical protein [Sinomonas soli]